MNHRLYTQYEFQDDEQERRLAEEQEESTASAGSTWMPMDTAPKDGSEILVWRDDCGILLARWAAPVDFLTEDECEEIGESAEEYDWFYADFVAGGRLDGCETPQLWIHLPDEPN